MGNYKKCKCSNKNCKINIDKLEEYVEDGRVAKIKSYSSKHGIDLGHIVFSKGRNLLHLCCKLSTANSWQGSILSYLIQEGVSCDLQDTEGNTPLHLALKSGLKGTSPQQIRLVYTEMVLPQLELFPHLLEIANNKNVTCRKLLDKIVKKVKEYNTSGLHESEQGSHDEASRWNDRLEQEMQDEYFDFHGDDYFHGQFNEETEDEWAERIHREIWFKRKRIEPECGSSTASSSKQPKTDAEEKLKKSRERMKQEYERYQKQARENRNQKLKQEYEAKRKKFFSGNLSKELSYDDIPWPSKDIEDLSKVLFCDLLNGDKESYKKYLREQQICWHPDKFTQKLGHIIKHSDRERVLERVKEISQELNRLSDKL